MADHWQIFIDTGGTFTDCLAVDPDGAKHRAKVLSSGRLRVRILGAVGRRLRLDPALQLADGFLVGYRLESLNGAAAVTVVDHDAAANTVAVDGESPLRLTPGAAWELSSGEEAVVLACRMVCGTPLSVPLPPIRLRLGTTRGTNALLERRGAKVALLITKGFGDLLEIGDQQRPDLFALQIEKRSLLHQRVIEVPHRHAADGTVVEPLSDDHLEALRSTVERLVAEEAIDAVAVALLHSYCNPDHERKIAAGLDAAGLSAVIASSDVAPLIGLLSRAETAVIEAYLAPLLGSYLSSVQQRIGDRQVLVMTSAGGLLPVGQFRATDSLLSGPAAGVVGASRAARSAGIDQVISFDMGGTSTDVARCGRDHEYRYEQTIADTRLAVPALAIHTVAAGGGSICDVRHGTLTVGPRSAGAAPGPACYGAGGPLTITDVNLLSGRLEPAHFEIPIDPQAAARALAEVISQAEDQTGQPVTGDELLDGYLQLANEKMAEAIEQISVAQGYDPRDHALVAFGGAGGQHACAVATRLGIDTVILPPDAALLSAVGLEHAVVERFAQRQVLRPLSEVEPVLMAWIGQLHEEAIEAVVAAGHRRDTLPPPRVLCMLRGEGQETPLSIEHATGVDLARAFRQRYEETYRHPHLGSGIEVESIRVIARGPATPVDSVETQHQLHRLEASATKSARFEGTWRSVPVFERADLSPGAVMQGPALLVERRTTIVIEPQFTATFDAGGAVVCRRDPGARGASRGDRAWVTSSAVVQQSLFANRLGAIVAESGHVLQRTARSTNVKHRLDFSCGLLDADGELVVNAPHIPVHLGAMGLCVRSVLAELPIEQDDVIVTNHPAFGGAHLPDVTVITPVFSAESPARRLGFIASRAHHAEIGGCRPGSMPPGATTLIEEGVIIPPMRIIEGGVSRLERIRSRLTDGRFPSRAVEDNIADILAAVAANHRGAEALAALASAHGATVVLQHMEQIKDRAERLVRAALRALPDGRREAREALDDGAVISVAIEITGDHAGIDFTGTSAQHPGNLNATPAIVASAVMYVLRLLMGPTGVGGPLNEGIMRAVDLVLPRCMLNPDFAGPIDQGPAVVGGNVETSQRIVDALLSALDLCAGSQGTMNNVLFGNDRFGYYETICGGAGAVPGGRGADAVHTHMTNTRLTDPEVLEQRYPVRVVRFEVRRGSGGTGRHRGGDGVIRELEFLEPVSLSILSQHRRFGPSGAAGGGGGKPGRQWVIRADRTTQELGAIDGCEMAAGDRLVMETPGGGGWGPA